MKKNLLLLVLVYIAITAYGQNSVPNGNFENWNSDTYDYPQNYPYTSNYDVFFQYQLPFNEVKTTNILDAFHGNYAVKISSISFATETAIGYFINTNPNNGGPDTWTGGIPYSQIPNGIRGYYKYNVATADSGLIIVAFSKDGANIGTYFCKVGGIHDTYSLFNFTFSPALSESPDSVMFGATSSDITVSDDGVAGSVLFIDSVSFTGVTSQPDLMNGDFELWQSQTFYAPDNWSIEGAGVNMTADVAAGDYAIELTTYLGENNGNPKARAGEISNGYWDNSCGCNNGGYPFSNQIDTLVFYYKYAPSGNDSAVINLNFKNNGSDIGGRQKYLLASVDYQYTEFSFEIGQAPDTVIVQISSSNGINDDVSFVGSDLIIDEIHFKSQPLTTGIFNYENDNNISIFPNPSNGKFQIQNLGFGVQNLEIYNVLAEKIYSVLNFQHQTCLTGRQASNEIDLSSLPKGIYFIKIYNGEKTHTEKIVIQ